jgi:hypothetical protein
MTWLGAFTPEAYDLLHVATAIHHVDRLAPRASSGRLTQPDLLPRNLSYARPQRTEQRDCHFDRMADTDEVGLFSGGLDSLAGTRARLKKKDRSIYLWSSLGTSVILLQRSIEPCAHRR